MKQLVVHFRCRSGNFIYVLATLVMTLGLVTGNASAQPITWNDVDSPEEFITAIETANAAAESGIFSPTYIYVAGYLVFAEAYDEEVTDGIRSILPTIRNHVTINLGDMAGFDASAVEVPSGDKLTAFKTEDEINVTAESAVFLSVFFNDGNEFFPKPSPPSQFKGFDNIISSINSTVAVEGLSAPCKEQCIKADNSLVIVRNAHFDCGIECINFIDPFANLFPAPDFAAMHKGISDSDLNAEQKVEFGINLEQTEAIFARFDFAVVNSNLQSQNAVVTAIGSESDPHPARVLVDRSLLHTDSSGSRVLQIKSASDENRVTDTVLSGPDSRRELLSMTYGSLTAENLFINRGTNGINILDGSIDLGLSAVSTQGRDPELTEEVCRFGFLSDKVNSNGYNIVSDDTCSLSGPGDLENTDPGLFLPGDGSLIPQFEVGSPAIDGGPVAVTANQLPCGTRDITGLPRPQDGNGDGTAECDVGPVELQAGEDISAPQSGAYYDLDRDGEGVFVEMLGDDKAVVYIFSYTPGGEKAFWAVGIGDVVGNGIVIAKENFVTTRGGIFGINFNPATVEEIPFADISISFPGCKDSGKKGVLAIAANNNLGFGPLLSRTSRLTSVVSCETVTALGPGFSGSLYDPTHDGEGVIVQVISPTRAVVIWFTYDSEGNQQWILGVGVINGNTITVTDAITQTGPGYGPDYDMTKAVQTVWGNFGLVFEPDCNKAILNYDSLHIEYGSGMQNLQRLTNLSGVTCGL